MNYDCSLWHHHSSLQHTWCHAPMMSSPTEERWHHGWSEVPPEYFMGLVSEWCRWYLIIKRLMKVFLTLSFVSNERVTDLMSHDAEEIWWGHPLNFSQCSLAGISWNSLVGLRSSRTSLCETIFCILCVSNRSLWCCFITCPCILPVGLKGRRYLENSSDDKLSKQPQHFLIRTNSVCSDSLWWTSPHIFVITVVTGPQFCSSLTSRFKPFLVSWADEFSSRDV